MLARTLLVWFVLLALPFQGYAAAAMACAHGFNPVAQPAQASPPCHGAAHDEDAQPVHEKCGNCAACSVGAAIAPALPDTAAPACPRGPCPSTPVAPLAAFNPDLPDRPPRPSLA